MGAGRPPGPQGRRPAAVEININDGTLCGQPSPAAGPLGRFSLWPELYSPGFLAAAWGTCTTDADKAEFAIIKRMPVYDHRRRPYGNVNSYVSDRTLYFGSPSTYASFAAESDLELANTEWRSKKRTRTLRSMLEFGKKHEAQKQQIFYRWVRKAYQRKYGGDVNVPDLIRKGMSQQLADKIAAVRGSVRVKKIHEEQFKAGGFNPRPIKYNHHYLLGTLSEHATGMAVDIDDKRNAQLTAEEWKFIESLVGRAVVRSGRWATDTAAESLWKDIKSVNDLFILNVAVAIQRIEKERAEKAASHSTKTPLKSPLEEVLGKHLKSLAQWTAGGFFHLPLDLVLELREHGFRWGATFSTNVDLHHFELPED